MLDARGPVSHPHRARVLEFDLDVGRLVRRFERRNREREHVLGRRLHRVFQQAGLIALVHQVLVHAVRLLGRGLDRDALFLGVVQKIGAASEPAQELRVLPGRVDLDLRRQGGVAELEPDLVVALAGRAVGEDVGALADRDLGLAARDERPRQGGAKQVAVLVDRVARDRRVDEVRHELAPDILDVDLRGPDRLRAAGLGVEVLALADIDDHCNDVETTFLQGAQDDGRVEATAVRENGFLARHGRAFLPGRPRIGARGRLSGLPRLATAACAARCRVSPPPGLPAVN